MMLSKKLFDIYAILHSSKELNFDDFAEINYLLKSPAPLDQSKGIANKRAVLCFYFFKQHAILDPKQAQGQKGELDDSFDPTIFVHVGT